MRDSTIVVLIAVVFFALFGWFAIHEANEEREHLRDCDKRHGVYMMRDRICADSVLVRY